MSNTLKKTLIFCCIVVLLTLLSLSAGYFIMGKFLEDTPDNSDTNKVSTLPTASNEAEITPSASAEEIEKVNFKDYIGQWYNKDEEMHGIKYHTELDITEVHDNDYLRFNLYLYNSRLFRRSYC